MLSHEAKDLSFAINHLCEAFMSIARRSDSSAPEGIKIKETIQSLKGLLGDLKALDSAALVGMLKTRDPDIMSGLARGPDAPDLTLFGQSQLEIAQDHPNLFLSLCDHGLRPPSGDNTPKERLVAAAIDIYRNNPVPETARCLKSWFARDVSAYQITYVIKKSDWVRDAQTVGFVAQILSEKVVADPESAKGDIILMAARSELFSIMAMMLAGAEPASSINSRPAAIALMTAFQSNHGRAAMHSRHGPLAKHLTLHDGESFKWEGI